MKSPILKVCYAAVIMAAVAYAFFTLRGPNGIGALLEKREQIRELEKRNEVLARENEARRDKIRRLRESQSEQEMEIRRRLKLVRPGEKVFILEK